MDVERFSDRASLARVLSGYLRPIETPDGSRTMCVAMGQDRLELIVGALRGLADHLEASPRKGSDGRQDARTVMVDEAGLAAVVSALRSERPSASANEALRRLLAGQGYS